MQGMQAKHYTHTRIGCDSTLYIIEPLGRPLTFQYTYVDRSIMTCPSFSYNTGRLQDLFSLSVSQKTSET